MDKWCGNVLLHGVNGTVKRQGALPANADLRARVVEERYFSKEDRLVIPSEIVQESKVNMYRDNIEICVTNRKNDYCWSEKRSVRSGVC